MTFSTLSSFVTSPTWTETSAPVRDLMSSADSSRRLCVRPIRAIRAPRVASSEAIPAPMPRPAPVTSATWPLNLSMCPHPCACTDASHEDLYCALARISLQPFDPTLYPYTGLLVSADRQKSGPRAAHRGGSGVNYDPARIDCLRNS